MFSLIERPVHYPGHTLILADTRGPVVDVGVDHNGWVYLNRIEATEIGRLFGLVEGEVHETALARVADLEADLAAAEERIEEAAETLLAFRATAEITERELRAEIAELSKPAPEKKLTRNVR